MFDEHTYTYYIFIYIYNYVLHFIYTPVGYIRLLVYPHPGVMLFKFVWGLQISDLVAKRFLDKRHGCVLLIYLYYRSYVIRIIPRLIQLSRILRFNLIIRIVAMARIYIDTIRMIRLSRMIQVFRMGRMHRRIRITWRERKLNKYYIYIYIYIYMYIYRYHIYILIDRAPGLPGVGEHWPPVWESYLPWWCRITIFLPGAHVSDINFYTFESNE